MTPITETALQYLHRKTMEYKRQRYSHTPEKYLIATRYSEKTANDLTRCVIAYVRLHGGQAERISVTGRYIAGKPTKIQAGEVAGFGIERTQGKWLPPTMQRGSSDISATIRGRSVKIEIKVGRDVQSEAQKAYQRQIEAAGGIYIIVGTLEQFHVWYQSNFGEGGV